MSLSDRLTSRDEIAERIGELADRANDILGAGRSAPPPTVTRVNDRLLNLIDGVEGLRDELRKLHIEMGYGNPWEKSA